ncbi:MAG: N-acetylmuramoyl-L-alanine amidase [Holosporales bacterium]
MGKLFTFASITALLTSAAWSTDLKGMYPNVFEQPTGIKVAPITIGDLSISMPAYQVLPFPEEEANRNHYDERFVGEGGAKQMVACFSDIPQHQRCLVMHYTVADFARTMDIFTRNVPDGRVSAHYVLTQTEGHGIPAGQIFSMVSDNQRAWHAGISYWRGMNNLNPNSIGIENINKGFVGDEASTPTWFAFDEKQIETLGRLSQYLVQNYNIAPWNVVGHADIAPGRKQDPGILFPWGKLYHEYGVGAWLDRDEQDPELFAKKRFIPKEKLPRETNDSFFLSYMKKYGYDVDERASLDARVLTDESVDQSIKNPVAKNVGAIKAFRAHFSKNGQAAAYNEAYDENDMYWIWALNAKYPSGL